MRDASGLGIRSAGDLEPGLFDLEEEIAGEAGLDAQRALDPLPGRGDDILVEPLAGGVVQWPDRDDRAVVGYLEVAHVRDFHRGGMCLDGLSPAGARPAEIAGSLNRMFLDSTARAPPQRRGRARPSGLALGEWGENPYRNISIGNSNIFDGCC